MLLNNIVGEEFNILFFKTTEKGRIQVFFDLLLTNG